ncbi:unnamed protein product [Phytophthora fragariaefolia]|uniref:Unnamed protein product n=1 Tax=Phytophthora fragariaefolia TaxID=1490495 RepID=A0A9W6XXM1_9STRA|nr:unnamed protein product [Phytophthora fragariaefolia]
MNGGHTACGPPEFLAELGWSEPEFSALQMCKDALEHALTLAHPDPEKCLCMFADASDLAYKIHDIPGDSNVWVDLLSRFGSSFITVAAIRLTSPPVAPQLDEWPTLEQVMVVRPAAVDVPAALKPDDDRVSRDNTTRIWLPADTSELQLRMCIVGHFGAQDIA